jgi:hypothetical protein
VAAWLLGAYLVPFLLGRMEQQQKSQKKTTNDEKKEVMIYAAD